MDGRTEEEARLRASAAGSIVEAELDTKDLQSQFDDLRVQSTTSTDLADNELKRLSAIGEDAAKLLAAVSSAVTSASSAVAAAASGDGGARILTAVDRVSAAKLGLSAAGDKLAACNDASAFSEKIALANEAKTKLGETLAAVQTALEQAHALLFGR
jgi:hypothetical protein